MVLQQPNLYLPPQGSPPGDLAPATPRTIRTWLARLPSDDPMTAASRLFSTLVRLNGYILEPADRFKALELIRESHTRLRRTLRERYLQQQLPLDTAATRVASLVRRLDDAMATGYKLTIADLSGRSEAGALFRRRTMPVAIYRALSHIGASISDAYEVYVPPSPPLWHDLHELYRFAVINDLHQRKLKLDLPQEQATPSITGAYTAVLLLSLANPFRLHHGDVPRISARLQNWSQHCRLQPIDEGTPPQHRVGVVTGSARAPEYLLLNADNDKNPAWYLDTQPLAWALIAESHAAAPQQAKESADTEPRDAFLARLASAWDLRSRRRYSRSPASARVEASLGLHQLHHLLGMATDNAANVSATDREQAGDHSPPTTPAGWTPQIEVWRMQDRSPGGYRLSLKRGQAANTSVGELIGVRGYPPKSLAAGGWRVGVVRWLRNIPGSALEAGVEWLAPKARSVKVQTVQANGRASEQLEALMLPRVRVYDRNPTLVTPAFVSGSTPNVMVGTSSQQTLSLTGEEENTGEHARFWYQPQTTDESPTPTAPTIEDSAG